MLDMCAAPGGKTTALAEFMHDQGEIVALDRTNKKVATPLPTTITTAIPRPHPSSPWQKNSVSHALPFTEWMPPRVCCARRAQREFVRFLTPRWSRDWSARQPHGFGANKQQSMPPSRFQDHLALLQSLSMPCSWMHHVLHLDCAQDSNSHRRSIIWKKLHGINDASWTRQSVTSDLEALLSTPPVRSIQVTLFLTP